MALKNRQYFNGGYQANMNALEAIRADETEKNVQAGKKAVKVIVVALALLITAHFATGCLPTDDNIIRQAVCSTVKPGEAPIICNH